MSASSSAPMPSESSQTTCLQIIEPAFEVVEPSRGALQTLGGADVEHQEAVDVADQRVLVEVGREQVRVARLHAAVAAHVQVPALLGGDDADVLALRFGAFAGAAGHGQLDLVRRAQALVAVLQVDREPDAVLHAVAAPGRADAGLHRAQGLAVGVAGLEAGQRSVPPRSAAVGEAARRTDRSAGRR